MKSTTKPNSFRSMYLIVICALTKPIRRFIMGLYLGPFIVVVYVALCIIPYIERINKPTLGYL